MPQTEIKINARGLSNPGPRMMVQNAIDKGATRMRIVVSSAEAIEDLKAFLASKTSTVRIDEIGEEWHMVVEI